MLSIKNLKNICIIPAKGSSQRFPEKNKALFFGKPLVALAIEVSLEAGIFDAIYVSSEDESILKIAQQYPIQIIERPEILAHDPARVSDVCKSLLVFLRECLIACDAFSVVIPTSPLRTAKHLQEAYKLFLQKKVDCVASVTPLIHPPQAALRINNKGALQAFLGIENLLKKTQELEQLYIDDGTIVISKTSTFLTKDDFYDMEVYPYIVPFSQSVDVDTELDLKWAHFLKSCTSTVSKNSMVIDNSL